MSLLILPWFFCICACITINETRKIIIDTDGSFNSVFSLMYGLEAYNHELLEIVAITTVESALAPLDAFRNVVHMVNLTKTHTHARQFLSIPIGKPQKSAANADAKNRSSINHDGLFGWSHTFYQNIDIFSTKRKVETAFASADYSDDVLVQQIVRHPHEIDVIMTGALTNLYAAENKHPGLIALIHNIYILGGMFWNGTATGVQHPRSERNFEYDSAALAGLFGALNNAINIANVFIFPLDSTQTIRFGVQDISLLYTFLNTDIQTEIEMCRMKMEKELHGDLDPEFPDEADMFDFDRDDDAMNDYGLDDLQCTQTALTYLFVERIMEETVRENYMLGLCDCAHIGDAAVMAHLLYPQLYEFKNVLCKVDETNGMVWYAQDLRQQALEPNCWVNVRVDADKIVHVFTRDSVSNLHTHYMDRMQFLMDNMNW